jgi:hypothetical protein
MRPYLPPTVLSHVKLCFRRPGIGSWRRPTPDMAHGSENAAESQLSAAARTADHGNYILLMRGASEHAQWPPNWYLNAVLIVGLTRCARLHGLNSARIPSGQIAG